MAVIDQTKDESVAVLRMINNTNQQNLEFADQMNQTLDNILEDKDIYSIIITSSDEKNFSQGVDIDWLTRKYNAQDFESIKLFLYGINNIFKKILLMPVPVIAAINGHAFGNGAILACACDFRFMKKDKGFFCFPEVDISIAFLPGMIEFIRKAIPEYKFNEMKLSGRRVAAAELEEHHIIEKASQNQEELIQDALNFAKGFKKNRAIFGEHKKRMHKKIIEVIDNEDPKIIESLNLLIQE
jgi:enoyl-CoA hydratase/carnithine racemase